MACVDENAAVALLEGSLAAGESAELLAHAAECDSCRELVAALAKAATLTQSGQSRDATPTRRRGDAVDRYVLLGQIGEGGMGVIYLAYDPDLDRRVALKFLREPSDRQRLLREAQAVAKLSHPNVVSVHDVGTIGEELWVAMEYVEGATLREWLAEGGRTWQQVVDRFVDAGRGLAAAHAAGIVHRDFKPENVIVAADGRARVLDFGLATHDAASAPIGGTPRYMAPEQAAGKQAGPAADQYSFCIALDEALRQVPRVPSRIGKLLARGLAREPADRYPSLDALLAALTHGRQRKRMIGALALTAVAIGMLAASVGRFADPGEPPCKNAAASVRSAWNAQRRTRVRAAMLAHHLPFGDSTWRAVEKRLDEYAKQWAAMRVDSCEATHVRNEQSAQLFDLRVACLDGRLAELTAFVGALEHATAESVIRSIDAANRLPALAPCADRAALAATTPPPNPAIASQVARIRDQLAPAVAQQRLGNPSAARDIARRACAGALALGYQPLLARCRYLLGTLANDAAGDPAGAVDLLTESITAAVASNDAQQTADAAIALAHILGADLRRIDEAARWTKLADAAGARLADKRVIAARTAGLRGLFALLEGRHADALPHVMEQLRLQESMNPNSRDSAAAHNYVGTALMRLRRFDEAEQHLQRALRLTEQLSGASHPDLMSVLDALAGLEMSRGRDAAVVPYVERSLAITRGAREVGHPWLIGAIVNVGVALTNVGELDRAMRYFDEAQSTVRPTDRQGQALIQSNLVRLYQLRKDRANTLATAERALRLEREVKGENHPETALAYYNVGATRLNGQARDAVAPLETALGIMNKTLPKDDPNLALCADELRKAKRASSSARRRPVSPRP